MDAALGLLARRALSEGEIGERLAARGFSEGEIAAARERLRELGLVDDRDLALRLARSLRDARGAGPLKVAAALRRRLIPRSLAEEAVRAAFAEGEEFRAAAAALGRRWRGAVLEDRKEAARAYRFLAGRGFSPEACRRAVAERFRHIPDEEAGDRSDRR